MDDTVALASIDRVRPPKGSLVAQAYDRLKGDIFDFRLMPGERFAEQELAARTGVSRTPLRAALFQLLNDGLVVKVEGHAGWQIRPLDLQYFEHLYDVRLNLELICVRRICAAEPFPDLSELRSIWLVPVEERLTDGKRVAALDEAFHGALVRAAGNPEMARIHADLTDRIRIIRRLDFIRADRIDLTYVEHGKILRAILARKAPQAEMLIRAHIEASTAEIRHITLHKLSLARAASESPEAQPRRARGRG